MHSFMASIDKWDAKLFIIKYLTPSSPFRYGTAVVSTQSVKQNVSNHIDTVRL